MTTETRADWPGKRWAEERSWVRIADRRVEVTYRTQVFIDDDFAALGKNYEESRAIRPVALGDGALRIVDLRDLVAWSTAWMARHRGVG